jgi:4,5-DOPA dioxygenase extradiol
MKDVMPILFIGHGSPMNVVQENEFTSSLKNIAAHIPRPQAIVVISAHWLTEGTFVTGTVNPEQIYDFYGFPRELYQVSYRPPGSTRTADRIIDLGKSIPVIKDYSWGIDHGAWAILKHLYAEANIPVIQISIDFTKDAETHYEIGKILSALRDEKILIIGSGNVVHNLSRMSHEQFDENPYPWAVEFDGYVEESLKNADAESLIHYDRFLYKAASLSVPTNDHYLPLLYIEAIRRNEDKLHFFHKGFQHKSISMRSFTLS